MVIVTKYFMYGCLRILYIIIYNFNNLITMWIIMFKHGSLQTACFIITNSYLYINNVLMEYQLNKK